MAWYVNIFYDDPAYAPEYGDEELDRLGPFESWAEANEAADDYDNMPFGVEVYEE
jgi:hypothetical protein